MTNNTQEYNGWTNYETWLVNTWLANEYSIYAYVNEAISEYAQDSDYERADIVREVARIVEEAVIDMADDNNPTGLVRDLITSAIGNVNFREIATHFVDDSMNG